MNTHLHADHCGGNHLFAGKPIYVQRRELDDARSEEGYTIREWVEAPGVQYVPVDGELELLPGLRLVPAPGHCDGHADGGRRDRRPRPVIVGGDVAVWHGEFDEPPTEGRLLRARARPRAGLARARARAVATPAACGMTPAPCAHAPKPGTGCVAVPDEGTWYPRGPSG